MLSRPNMRFLLMNRRRYLLEDNFSGSLNRWTVTDTEGKISVSNGTLVFSGGKAAPAWGDPRIVSAAFTRRSGLTVDVEIFPTAYTVNGQFAGFADNPAPNSNQVISLQRSTSLVFQGSVSGPSFVTPAPYLNQSQITRVVAKAAGYLFYVSSDGGITWSLAWETSTQTVTPLYAAILSYNMAFTSSYARVYQGYAKPADYSGTPTAPTPTLGADYVNNGTFGADTNWSKPSGGWAIASGVATADGLVATAQLINDGANANGWFLNSYDLVSRSAGTIEVSIYNTVVIARTVPGTYVQTTRSLAANGPAYFIGRSNFAGSIDNVSTKLLTLSTCLGTAVNVGTKNGISDSTWTLTAGTQAGHVICLDDETNPLYFILCYHNGTNAVLETCENGVYTTKISVAATYSAGAQIRIVKVGTAVALYYNNVMIGSTQTIDTSTGYGTKFAPFSTLSTNTPGLCAVNTGIGV